MLDFRSSSSFSLAQGSRLDCNRSSSSLMFGRAEDVFSFELLLEELELELDEEEEETLTLT